MPSAKSFISASDFSSLTPSEKLHDERVEWLSVKEAAAVWPVALQPATFRSWRARKNPPVPSLMPEKIGRGIYLRRDAVEAYIKALSKFDAAVA